MCCCGRTGLWRIRRRSGQWMAGLHNGDLIEIDRLDRFVLTVPGNLSNRFSDEHARGIALAEDRVVLIERWLWRHRDKELRTVGIGSCVGHSKSPSDIEIRVRRDLVVEVIARVSSSRAQRVATLDHETRNDTMKRCPVVERLSLRVFVCNGIGPFFAAGRQSHKILYGQWGFLGIKPTH